MLSLGVAAVILFVQAPAAAQSAGPGATTEAVVADTGVLRHANHVVPPLVYATRIPAGASPIRIDGKLDDDAWHGARAASHFLQSFPHEGEPATERTEVRIVYDDEAIYIAARMYDATPSGVRAQLARRDAATEADLFEAGFDSYHDHNTSFVFGLNPSGVKTDRVVSNDGVSSDDGWDAVWEGAAQEDSTGWTAEMRIPLSQLRYSPAAAQVWGVNFFRRIQRKAESDVFAYSQPSARGYSSFFGHLLGLEHLPQSRRLELVPYATTRQERIDPRAANNPFNNGRRNVAGAGLDAKYGLTSGLTLDATINPDFGQVDADPAYVNLSAFEQFLNERRPFFVEGANIFNFNAAAQLFYSRRIGRAPQGTPDDRGGFVDMPDHASIAGAGKLSGRVGAWSVGMLEATTARTFATVDSSRVRFSDQVEPLTNYFVTRGRRDLNGGADQLGFIATAVNRDVNTTDLRFLRSSAYVGGVDFGHRFLGNTYNFSGSLVGSRIAGDTLAIQRAQRSSARYFQRPDARSVRYDPAATSLGGWSGMVNLAKEAGDYQFAVNASAVSPGFEVNDAGFQTYANSFSSFAYVNRRWTRPGRLSRFAFAGNNISYGSNFDGVRTNLHYNANLNVTFLNYWNTDLHYTRAWRMLSDNLTRGGPLASQPGFNNVSGGIGSDTRRRFSTYNGGYYVRNDIGGWGTGWFSSVDFRPTDATTISVQPNYTVSESKLQYILAQTDVASVNTYGRQYLFSEVRQHSLDLTTRLNITFRPDLSLQLYTQPFVSTADYHNLKELARSRSLDYTTFGRTPGSTLTCYSFADAAVDCALRAGIAYYIGDADGPGPLQSVRVANRNRSDRSLSGNAVMRWEYRPGSTLFFVWSTQCSAGTTDPRFSAPDDVRRLCQGPSDNVFAIKANYWLSF